MKKGKNFEDIYSSDAKLSGKYVDIYSEDKKHAKLRLKGRVSLSKVFSILFFLILGLIGSSMIYFYNTLNSLNYDNSIILDDDNEDSAVSDQMVLNVLLVGSDSLSKNENGRSDSLLILSLNLKTKKIKITSIMRDTWVNIPSHSGDRINAAFSFGGAKLTMGTVERNFGIKIDRYIAVDFLGFCKIVDTLGGIDLEVTSAEASFINKNVIDKKNQLKGGGVHHLNGDQTLQYARNRDSAGSDYDRTQRQRTVLITIFKQLKTANLAQLTQSITTLMPTITTSFNQSEVLRIGKQAMKYLNFEVEDFRIPTNDNVRNENYGGRSVLVINDLAKARADLFNFIYEPAEKVVPKKATQHDVNQKTSEKSVSSKNAGSGTSAATQKVNPPAKRGETKSIVEQGPPKTVDESQTTAAQTSSSTPTNKKVDSSKLNTPDVRNIAPKDDSDLEQD